GDLGADVLKLEPPGGDITRTRGPFPSGLAGPETSATFLYLNTSKRSAVADLDSPDGLTRLAALVARSDVIVAGETAGELAARGLGPDQIRDWNPRAVLTTISGFGSEGPHAGYRSSNLITCAAGGWADTCGAPDREPIQAGGDVVLTLAGAFGAVGTLLAILGRDRHGHGAGDRVDVSAQEAALVAALIPSLWYEYTGQVRQRDSAVASGPSFILPCADGHIGVNVLTQAQWELLCNFMGRPEMAADPSFAPGERQKRAAEIRECWLPALAGRTAAEIFHEGQAWRVPFGLVPDAAGIRNFRPHIERAFFAELDHPGAAKVTVPGSWFRSQTMAADIRRPPLLGEHTAEIPEAPAAPGDAPPHEAPAALPPPLDGVRIVDLTMFMSGPMATQICADAGSEVIKVESVQRLDGWRGGGRNGATPDETPAWERSPFFNWVNRNKHGITLNLTDERGVEILKQLVAGADVLIENYTPRVMESFGLTYDALRTVKPDLIMISMPGFGLDVSWRDYVAFGMSTEQMSGMAHFTGYEDGPPIFTGSNGGDPFVGVLAALTLLSALRHRDRTGEGQHIDLSQIEATTMYLGHEVTGWALTGIDPGRRGNHDPIMAPHNTYPCRDGRWIAIACRDDEEWRALAKAAGWADWLAPGSGLETAKGRRARLPEIDEALAAWTKDRVHTELADELQRRGVTAAAVLNGPELLADPHLAARGFFIPQDRRGVGVKHYPGQPFRFAGFAGVEHRRSPLLGEHTNEVLRRLLGLSDAELRELEAADVTGTVPLAAR
ncbi:MAG: CaiB/BaiF CoA transferase family protein, partial [Dehalococcoidia bacterium]